MFIVIFFLPIEEISKVIKVAKMFLKPKLNIENILKPSFFNFSVTRCTQRILLDFDYCINLKYHSDDHRYWMI